MSDELPANEEKKATGGGTTFAAIAWLAFILAFLNLSRGHKQAKAIEELKAKIMALEQKVK